ncbi:MAG: transglycosylase SLT domain-containing protein [Myxococcota bacterium]
MIGSRVSKVVSLAVVALMLLCSTSALADEGFENFEQRAKAYRKARDLVDSDASAAVELTTKLVSSGERDVLYLYWDLHARALLEVGRQREARDMNAAIADAFPDSHLAPIAAVRAAELSVLIGQVSRAEELVDVAKKRARDVLDSGPERRFVLARALRLEHDLAAAQGDGSTAKEAAEQLLVEYPAEASTHRPGLTVSADALSSDARLRRARNLYDHWAYHDAREAYRALLEDDEHEGTARWYLAHIALNKLRDKPERAEQLFARLAEEGPHRHESLYQVARAQMRQERYDDALETLDTYLERYPRGSHVESVYYYRGWLPYDHRENDRAIEGFKAYISRYGKGSGRSSYVYGFLAWTYMREARWRDAIDTYEKMRPWGNTLVEGKALYWQAYAFWKLGEESEALSRIDQLRDEYAVSYYSMLGEQLRARIEGRDARASRVWWPEDGGQLDDEPAKSADKWALRGLSGRDRAQWGLAQKLVELGEKHRARRVVDEIRGDLLRAVPAAKRDAWRHALGHFVGDYHHIWEEATGNSIAAHPTPPEPESLEAKMAYPRAYRDVVDDVAARFELPPEMMWAVMRQESRFRPGQISYTDAVGALQMIPRTARKVASDLGITYNPRTFHRPVVGFPYSGYYMRKLIDTFDGYIVPAAAAYNSGPQIVAYWIRQNPDAELAWLVEEFAYNEGRNYCRKVAEHMLRYLYLYEDDAQRRGEVLDAMFPVEPAFSLPEDVGY